MLFHNGTQYNGIVDHDISFAVSVHHNAHATLYHFVQAMKYLPIVTYTILISFTMITTCLPSLKLDYSAMAQIYHSDVRISY